MHVNPTLLLLPGLLCDEALWQHQIKALQGKAEIIVPDMTGSNSIEGLAANALRKAPDRFILAGLSMGGYVAQEILRQAPERVSKLFLIDTSARPDTPEQTRKRKGLIALANKGDFKGVTPRLLPMLIATERLEDVELTTIITDMAKRVGKEAFIRQQTAILNRIDSRPTLDGLKIPTTIICGEVDALTPPEHAKEMADLIGRNAQLHIIPNAGHLTPLETPEAVTEKLISAL